MESIDKLRTSLKACTRKTGCRDKFDTYWITADACDHLIDEIEAEIAECYMLQPEDADGVRIDLGDKLIEHEDGHEFIVDGVKIWGSTYEWWAYEDGGVLAPATRCTHVKPRTLEDVLVDMLEAAVGYSDAHTDVSLVAVEKYADEIRELLGFEIDEPDTIRNELEDNGHIATPCHIGELIIGQ